MQTFVPFTDNAMNAAALDSRRLNKQLLEGRQVYKILATNQRSGAWSNHPAVKMWRNYDTGLFEYLRYIKDECVKRGISTDKNWNALVEMHNNNWHRGDNPVMPAWWGDVRVHQSHRNNLYVKDPEYYADFANDARVTCCDKCNYFWPTHTLNYNNEFLGYFKETA